MLIELRIRDFAVIDDVALELGPGLNVLSGETGAGKSIVVGALSLLLGERASSELVRAGRPKATVEGVFDVSQQPRILELLDGLGMEGEDGLLILRREVAAEGRNRAWVNGSAATASVVGQLGSALVDLHGQHEHQTLLRPSEQRAIVDAYAGAQDLARSVAAHFGRVRDLEARLAAKEDRRRDLEGQRDFLLFQLGEIERADPQEHEDRLLEEEASRLEHSQDLMRDASLLNEALYAGEDALAGRISELQHVLRRIAALDSTLEPDLSALEDVYYRVAELGRRLGDYAVRVEHDPHRLEEIQSRLDVLFRLRRKYGPELSDVLATAARLRDDLEQLESASLDVGELERDLERARTDLAEASAELRKLRTGVADDLAREVTSLLPALGMPGAALEVVVAELKAPGPAGTETVEFRATLNPGFDAAPLSRIASGGELSRVMLALKKVLAEVDQVPTLVFDEIDAGIGGVVAGSVAEQLRAVSERHQVFVVTHLPQLASRAHTHFLVHKEAGAEKAATGVFALAGEDRITEIARMLGGDPESSTSREHARELLQTT